MVRLYPAKLTRFPVKCPIAPPISRPIPAKPQSDADPARAAMEDLLAEQREQNLRRAAAQAPADRDHRDAHHQRHAEPCSASPSRYSCHGARARGAVRAWRRGSLRAREICQIAQAEKTNESELSMNAIR